MTVQMQQLAEIAYVATAEKEEVTIAASTSLEAATLPKDPALPLFTKFACASGWKFSPANAVDGNMDTYWECSGNDQYIVLGLGNDVVTVSQIDIAWHMGDFMKNAFTIQTSLGEGFTDILSAVSTGETDDFERYPIPPHSSQVCKNSCKL